MLNMRNELRLDSQKFPDHDISSIDPIPSLDNLPQISFLLNPDKWYFYRAFILCNTNQYILVVQTKSEIIFANKYSSINNAKKAFLKYFPNPDLIKTFYDENTDFNPDWSFSYTPEKNWLYNQLMLLFNYYSKNKKERFHMLRVSLRELAIENKKGKIVNIKYYGDLSDIFPLQPKKKIPPVAYLGPGNEIIIQGNISRLINANHYFLECVYIQVENDGFRLMAIQKKYTLFNMLYKSLNDAKSGFLKKFGVKACNEYVIPEWSHFYYPSAIKKPNKQPFKFNQSPKQTLKEEPMTQKSHNYKSKKKDFGERFRIFRQLLKKSIEDFVKETHIPISDLEKLEEGTFIPDILTIGILCDRYGLNLTWLTYGKENIFYKETPKTPRYIYDYCMENSNDIESLNAFLETYAVDHEEKAEEPGE